MEKLFEILLKKFPDNHNMVMPLKRARSGARYILFLYKKFLRNYTMTLKVEENGILCR